MTTLESVSNERLAERIASLSDWISKGVSETPDRDADILSAFTELQQRRASAGGVTVKGDEVDCSRCQGNGEVVTDWARYLRGPSTDKGDEAVTECPDCNGSGKVYASPPIEPQETGSREAVAWLSQSGALYLPEHGDPDTDTPLFPLSQLQAVEWERDALAREVDAAHTTINTLRGLGERYEARALTAEASLAAANAQLVGEQALAARCRQLEADSRAIAKERDHLRWRLGNTFDGVMLLAERAKASVAELAQLGLARLVTQEIDGKQVPVAHAINLDDLIDMGESAMRQQATVAQFRQLKGHFVVHQRAVSHLLDRITSLSRKNSLDGGDMNKLRELRAELSGMIGREV